MYNASGESVGLLRRVRHLRDFTLLRASWLRASSEPLRGNLGVYGSARATAARFLLAACVVLAIGGPRPAAAMAQAHRVRLTEVMAGANGDSRLQFIEFDVVGRTRWGPQPLDPHFPEPRLILTFHDATGTQTAEFRLPGEPTRGPRHRGRRSVLMATKAFVERTGLKPDFLIPPLIHPVDGMVCLRDNPENGSAFLLELCLRYGNYQGRPDRKGCAKVSLPPAAALPIAADSPRSLRRVGRSRAVKRSGCASHGSDFDLGPPTPRNSAGATASIAATSLEAQGETLFVLETFAGNGRTCSTCHLPSEGFGLPPAAIADLFAMDPSDPLFVAENDLELSTLENSCLMREGDQRGLILENIDGFERDPVFRNAPHLLNIGSTAPYGLSSGFEDLQAFCLGAVRQHFPKTLARNGDPERGALDFRLPTPFELGAMEAFMREIRFPSDGNLDLERMIEAAIEDEADEAAIRRGEKLFFGETGSAQCFRCHSGPVLSDADGSLGTGTGNQEFDIGVVFRPENEDDGCMGGPGDPEVPLPPEFRRFSTPPLVGVAETGPFFHDNSAQDLRSAVSHYTTPAFEGSESGLLMERFAIDLTDQDVDDLVSFLRAISLDPQDAVELNSYLPPSREEEAGGRSSYGPPHRRGVRRCEAPGAGQQRACPSPVRKSQHSQD
jgi:cytochrome c peroxidase